MLKKHINDVPKAVLIDHVMNYLDDGSQKIIPSLSRHLEDIIPNKKRNTVDNCRRKGYYKLNNLCDFSCDGEQIIKEELCCPYLFLRINNIIINYTYSYRLCKDLFSNYKNNYNTLYEFYINNSRGVCNNKDEYYRPTLIQLNEVFRTHYIKKIKNYYNLFGNKKKSNISKYYLEIVIDLNTKVNDYMSYFISRGENQIIWKEFICPCLNIYFPKYDNLVIHNSGEWTREIWCLYITCILYKTTNTKYIDIINYPNNHFDNLYNYLDENIEYLENLIGPDKIPEPWKGFKLNYIPGKYIIDDGDDDIWIDQFDMSPQKEDPDILELEKTQMDKKRKEYQQKILDEQRKREEEDRMEEESRIEEHRRERQEYARDQEEYARDEELQLQRYDN
jgi:hypothetical protein